MSDPLSRYESIVDQHIRRAQERGEFDNLPGMGKPLPGRGEPDDELWWVKQYMRREGLSTDALLPTSLQLAKEIERLPETVRRLPSEYAVRELVRNLNRRIVDYLRAPTGPHVAIGPMDPDEIVARWREAGHPTVTHPAAATHPAAVTHPAAAASPREEPGWRRWFGRRRDQAA